MTTLSLRNSILSLMLIGGMAMSVNSFAQGRRGKPSYWFLLQLLCLNPYPSPFILNFSCYKPF